MPTDAEFPIVELRQYTLHPGQRDALIELFDRELLETREAIGMRVFGQFRDLDRPDRFVWFRGFPDMTARAAALHTFYTGPVWQAHRTAANATIADSDNVLLLHRATSTSGFADTAPRAQPGASATPASLFVATIYAIAPSARASFPGFFADRIAPALTAAGATLLGSFATEHSPNTFPRLPVREGEDVFVSLARFADPAAHALTLATLAATRPWRDHVPPRARRPALCAARRPPPHANVALAATRLTLGTLAEIVAFTGVIVYGGWGSASTTSRSGPPACPRASVPSRPIQRSRSSPSRLAAGRTIV